MNKIAELIENFCCKSKTISVWQEKPDLLDRFIVRIHSEATVYDAIMRNKNENIPTNERIFNTVKFLEEHRFWRLNPFSLIDSSESDPNIMKITSLLQKNSIKELWNTNLSNESRNKKSVNQSNPPQTSSNESKPSYDCDLNFSLSKSDRNENFVDKSPDVKNTLNNKTEQLILSSPSSALISLNPINTTVNSSPSSASTSSVSSCCSSSGSSALLNTSTASLITNTKTSSSTFVSSVNFFSAPNSTSTIDIQTSPRKFAVVSAKSIGGKTIRRNNILNEFNYDTSNNFSRTYAEAVRGSNQSSNINCTQHKTLKSSTSSFWE